MKLKWQRHIRKRQIDKVCYLKWKSAKRKHEIVMPFGLIMRKKKILRMAEKVVFHTTPIRCPKIEKQMAEAFMRMMQEKLARIEESALWLKQPHHSKE